MAGEQDVGARPLAAELGEHAAIRGRESPCEARVAKSTPRGGQPVAGAAPGGSDARRNCQAVGFEPRGQEGGPSEAWIVGSDERDGGGACHLVYLLSP
jgi:hypothetical protein